MPLGHAVRTVQLAFRMPLESGDVLSLAVALLAPLIVGVAVHFSLEPRARPWHSRLRKAPHRPPPAAFPLVWTYAYLAMGYASYLVYKTAKATHTVLPLAPDWPPLLSPPLVLYYLHYAWLQSFQFVFLGLRNLRLAFAMIVLLDLYVPCVLALWSTTVPVAAYILLPYVGWLLLLTYLNYYMLVHNPAHESMGLSKEEVIRQHNLPRDPKLRSATLCAPSSFVLAPIIKSRED